MSARSCRTPRSSVSRSRLLRWPPSAQRREQDVRPLLDGLVAKQILSRDDDPRSPERGQYAFLQALLRTVAYGTLSRRARKALPSRRRASAARHLAGRDRRHRRGAGRPLPAGDPRRPGRRGRRRAACVRTGDSDCSRTRGGVAGPGTGGGPVLEPRRQSWPTTRPNAPSCLSRPVMRCDAAATPTEESTA